MKHRFIIFYENLIRDSYYDKVEPSQITLKLLVEFYKADIGLYLLILKFGIVIQRKICIMYFIQLPSSVELNYQTIQSFYS